MERDFLGLNSKDSVVTVKEEAVEGCKNSEFVAFSKGSGVRWPLLNKVSALHDFMSFKDAEEEKTTNIVSDPVASSRFVAVSTVDTFDATHKCPSGEIQKVHDGQGGTHFSLTTYPPQHNAIPMHFYHDVKKMLPAANQPISVFMSNPFFKTHFAGAGQNFAGMFTNVDINCEHEKKRFSSKSSEAPDQLTIFYAGKVHVYEDISPEQAQAIMLLAGNGVSTASDMAQPRAQVQVPSSKQAGGDGVLVNQQPAITPPTSVLSSPISVSSHPVGQSGGGYSTNDEVKAFIPTVVSSTPVTKVDPPKIVTSLGPLSATTTIPSAVPQARKASLARFLEKRKERVMSSAPYSLGKISPDCATPGSNSATL